MQPGSSSAAVSQWHLYNAKTALSKTITWTTPALFSTCLSDNTFLHLQPFLLWRAMEPGSQGACLLLQTAQLSLSVHFQQHCGDYHPPLAYYPLRLEVHPFLGGWWQENTLKIGKYRKTLLKEKKMQNTSLCPSLLLYFPGLCTNCVHFLLHPRVKLLLWQNLEFKKKLQKETFILIQCFSLWSLRSMLRPETGSNIMATKCGAEQSYLPCEARKQKEQEGTIQDQDTAFKSMPQ